MSEKTGAEVLAELREKEAERRRGVVAARDARDAARAAKARAEFEQGMRGRVELADPRERPPFLVCKDCGLHGYDPRVPKGMPRKGLTIKNGKHESPDICRMLTLIRDQKMKAEAKQERLAGSGGA